MFRAPQIFYARAVHIHIIIHENFFGARAIMRAPIKIGDPRPPPKKIFDFLKFQISIISARARQNFQKFKFEIFFT